MTIQLTKEALRQIWPKAPQAVIDDFVVNQALLDAAGITHTRVRLSVACAQIEHETNGFQIKNLTENINYSHARAAEIWPSRFPGGEAQVRGKYGSEPGWQLRMFDDVYGNRMGNRPGTRDGSTFIGRGGPQITGRNGYDEVGKRARLPLTLNPQMAGEPGNQAAILAAFWTWKNLSPVADAGGLKACTKPWNGGYIGMRDREERMAGNDPIIMRLATAKSTLPIAKTMPGTPPTAKPPQEVIDATTTNERAARTAGAGSAVAGGAGEVGKAATEQPASPPPAILSPFVTWTLIGAGIAVLLFAAFLVARKKRAVIANWF